MNKIQLEIKELLYSQSSSGAYVLILGDKHSMRRLPIVIGEHEAQAIALGLEGNKPSRPLTHDLFKKFAEQYGVDVIEVVLTRFLEGVFYAMLVCKQGDDITMVDARPSDAIALAARFNCPISAYETVMNDAGIEMEEIKDMGPSQDQESPEVPEETPDTLENLTVEQLQKLLQIAIDEENYEKAAEIRDIINSKS
ncbi:MAG: bifunctional nuclease family protein [Bacteroidales bacterium]|nr:bifunctional nuclease family protein [Bacteroidales bacterium]